MKRIIRLVEIRLKTDLTVLLSLVMVSRGKSGRKMYISDNQKHSINRDVSKNGGQEYNVNIFSFRVFVKLLHIFYTIFSWQVLHGCWLKDYICILLIESCDLFDILLGVLPVPHQVYLEIPAQHGDLLLCQDERVDLSQLLVESGEAVPSNNQSKV